MRSFLIISALLLTAYAPAAEPILIVNKSGYWLTYPTEDGPPTWVQINHVIDMTGGTAPPVPPPTDPPKDPPSDPTPPPAGELAAKVKGWADAANHPMGRTAMKAVYTAVRERVEKGELPPERAPEAVTLSTDQVFKFVGGAEKWTTFRDNVAREAEALADRGLLDSQPEMVAFLKPVEQGLAATPSNLTQAQSTVADKVAPYVESLLDDLISGKATAPADGPF